ncbi:MAG: hypothetical protein V4474_02225 [Patescibacteria group bacterium]
MELTLEQQVQQRIAELPEDVRNAITGNELGAKVHAVGTKNQLHIDQVGELETQVYLAMLGFSRLEDFQKTLEKELALTPEVAQKVAADVGTDIFGAIRESMKKFAAAKAAPPAPAAPIAPAAAGTPAPVVPAQAPVSPQMQQATVVLSEKTVSVAPKPAEKPIYKADPYHEPI